MLSKAAYPAPTLFLLNSTNLDENSKPGPTVPRLKDHLFIQSLEKEGQELLRGESAMGPQQPLGPGWGGQDELLEEGTAHWGSGTRRGEDHMGEGGQDRDSPKKRESPMEARGETCIANQLTKAHSQISWSMIYGKLGIWMLKWKLWWCRVVIMKQCCRWQKLN